MRAQGRCAGDGLTGELKRITAHVLGCEAWARLYRENSDAALMPAEEYERWRRDDRPAEHQEDLAGRVADTQARRAASVARFRRPDPLED